MSTYLIGDIHGCYNELIALLKQINFLPKIDNLWLTGDLVARGPGSLEVLRYIKSLGDCVRIVLGNHDLHLLAVYKGIRRNNPEDCITSLLEAPDADELINWIRHQPFLQIDKEKKLIMTHAGITPQWDLNTTLKCASDIESMLASNLYPLFLNAMYRDTPNKWSSNLIGLSRYLFISNVFTRMRYCFPNRQLDMRCKHAPKSDFSPLKPWFSFSRLINKKYKLVFGHWSSLNREDIPENIYALDTGCCWGKNLTCLRWEDKTYFFQSAKRNYCLKISPQLKTF